MFQLPQRSTLFPYTTLFRSDFFGDDRFAAQALGHVLQSCRDIDGVAKCGEHHVVAIADVADDHFAAMKDRKSTRLNSSHTVISYAVFCLKKKKSYDNIKILA